MQRYRELLILLEFEDRRFKTHGFVVMDSDEFLLMRFSDRDGKQCLLHSEAIREVLG